MRVSIETPFTTINFQTSLNAHTFSVYAFWRTCRPGDYSADKERTYSFFFKGKIPSCLNLRRAFMIGFGRAIAYGLSKFGSVINVRVG